MPPKRPRTTKPRPLPVDKFQTMSAAELKLMGQSPTIGEFVNECKKRELMQGDDHLEELREWTVKVRPDRRLLCKHWGPPHNGLLFAKWDASLPLDRILNPSRCMPNIGQKVVLELVRGPNFKPNIAVFSPVVEFPGEHRLIFGWAFPGGSNDYAIDAITELLAQKHTINGYVTEDHYNITKKPPISQEIRNLSPNATMYAMRLSDRMKMVNGVRVLDFCVRFHTECPEDIEFT